MTVKKYQFEENTISALQSSKKNKVRESLGWKHLEKALNIALKPRGYKVNHKKQTLDKGGVKTISFFSGAGGLDIGAQMSGAPIISSLDFDKDSVATLQANRYFSNAQHIHGDIKDITGKDYKKLLKESNPDKLILIGGPPCQPFSKAGYWVTHKNRLGGDDPRNMIGQYLRLIQELKPNGFLLENVESLLHPKNKDAVDNLEEMIDQLGYQFIKYRADSSNFGVPQKRKRVFFIASQKRFNGSPIITNSAVEDDLGGAQYLPIERVVDWIAKYDKPDYFEKEELTISKTYDTELREIPPGENYFALTDRDNYPLPKFEANKRFWSFLLKLHPLLPSWTISAQPGPWVGPFHWNNRRLRVPEIAAIQTFPEDYAFIGSRRSVQKQIGNAVPVLLGKSMADFLISKI